MKQTKPFVVQITESDKLNCQELAKINNTDYGIMFTSSGKAKIERVNPTARYSYLYKTTLFQAK